MIKEHIKIITKEVIRHFKTSISYDPFKSKPVLTSNMIKIKEHIQKVNTVNISTNVIAKGKKFTKGHLWSEVEW